MTTPNMIRITALITCFNRREFTVSCLEHLYTQTLPSEIEMDVILVDDGSTDGTSEAVRAAFPGIRILIGTGNLFWCGGMRVAWNEAAKGDPDYYLLINDDTTIHPDTVAKLLSMTGAPDERKIAVATIMDRSTGRANYGGVSDRKKKVLEPEDPEITCDTFNANCALVTRRVFKELGNLSPDYTHSMGDYDYGYLAARKGVTILRSMEFLGDCPSNPIRGTWRDRDLPRLQRLKRLQHVKGLPFREWITFVRRNFGWKWPYYAMSPFCRILLGK